MSRELKATDFVGTASANSRQFLGVDFRASGSTARLHSREIAKVDYVGASTVGTASAPVAGRHDSREFLGADFVGMATEPITRSRDIARADFLGLPD